MTILKTVADNYQYGLLVAFQKIKVLFIHSTDRAVYLCSTLLAPEETIYELWLEDFLEIKPDIDDKLEAIPNFLQFYWKMKKLLKETSKMAMELKKEHDSTLIENRFKSSCFLSSFLFMVNLSILCLTEEKDKAGMVNLGPLFFPKGWNIMYTYFYIKNNKAESVTYKDFFYSTLACKEYKSTTSLTFISTTAFFYDLHIDDQKLLLITQTFYWAQSILVSNAKHCIKADQVKTGCINDT